MPIKSYRALSLITGGKKGKEQIVFRHKNGGPIVGMTQTTPAGAFLNQRNAYCEERM